MSKRINERFFDNQSLFFLFLSRSENLDRLIDRASKQASEHKRARSVQSRRPSSEFCVRPNNSFSFSHSFSSSLDESVLKGISTRQSYDEKVTHLLPFLLLGVNDRSSQMFLSSGCRNFENSPRNPPPSSMNANRSRTNLVSSKRVRMDDLSDRSFDSYSSGKPSSSSSGGNSFSGFSSSSKRHFAGAGTRSDKSLSPKNQGLKEACSNQVPFSPSFSAAPLIASASFYAALGRHLAKLCGHFAD